MDVSSVASMGSAMASAQLADAVSTAVLKKAIDIEAQGAAQLIEALPKPTNPAHQGNSVDVSA